MHLSRRVELHLQEVREHLNTIVVVEPEASMVASALNQVSWHLYDLRRALVRDLRASGASWATVGASLGVSKQSAMKQFHTVDGELEANRQASRPASTVEQATDIDTVLGRPAGYVGVESHPLWTDPAAGGRGGSAGSAG